MAVGEPEAERCVLAECPCARLTLSVLVLKAPLRNSGCLCVLTELFFLLAHSRSSTSLQGTWRA